MNVRVKNSDSLFPISSDTIVSGTTKLLLLPTYDLERQSPNKSEMMTGHNPVNFYHMGPASEI